MKSGDKNYHKLLENRISETLVFLRSAFKDNKSMIRDIDEVFEKTLTYQLSLIPNTWIIGFYESVEMVLDIAMSMDVKKLTAAINKHKQSRLWFDIDSYNMFMTHCIKNQGVSTNISKTIDNIAQQFKPIFTLVDYLFKHPLTILNNVCEYIDETDVNNDIFN